MNNTGVEDANWPLQKFYFVVDLDPGLQGVPFQEVSGLETEKQETAYRESKSPVHYTAKLPNIAKQDNITIKKGVFINNTLFREYYNQVITGTIAPRTVTIKLLNEAGKITVTWTLTNARPVKIVSADMGSEGNEIAVEAIELVHEGMAIANG